jgi:hypothetical protein
MVNFTTYGFKLCGKSVKDRIEKHYNKSRILTTCTANLTVPHKGRGSCQYRDLCSRAHLLILAHSLLLFQLQWLLKD